MRLAAAPTRPTCAFSVEPTTATGTGRVSLPSEITHTTLKTRSTAPRKSFHSNSAEKMPTVISAGRPNGTTATC